MIGNVYRMHIPKFQYSKKLRGKTVLLRLDLNVPIERRQILDDTRIRASLPTIEKLIERGAKVVILAHLGRPEGKKVMKYTLAPVAKRLSILLDTPVQWVDSSTIQGIRRSISTLRSGQVAMLENIRFHKGEEQNESWFAESLASLGDIFVFDGFGVGHRESPSVTGIPKYMNTVYAGYLVQSELAAFDTLQNISKDHTVGVVGGAKVETKLPLIEGLLPHCGCVLVGGAIVNTYLKARGYTVGKSLVNESFEFQSLQYMKRAAVITPIDVIIGNSAGTRYRVADILAHDRLLALPDEKILDIGPKTIQMYSKHLKKAKAIIWNGAMGYFEQPPYHIGTYAIARTIASRGKKHAYTIIGGGETIQSVEAIHMIDHIDHVSTGGGAMLEYIQKGTLPALDALG
jgi:phosphoglycerate kinase